MRFPKFGDTLYQRKGISSIVGGIFFLVLMTSGFTVYYVALDSQSQMLHTQQIIADIEIRKVQEKFAVSVSSDPTDNNKLSVQVSNQGPYTLEIADIWIVNKTLSTQPAKKTDIDYNDSFIPVGYGGNVLGNTPLYLVDDTYDIKVISTLGTIKTVEFDVLGGSNLLRADMYAIPPDVNIGENATIALYITNVGEATITALSPSALTLNPPGGCTLLETPPGGTTTLIGAETKFFTWQCQISGSVGTKVTFSADASGTLSGGPITSNTASDKVKVQKDDSGSGDTIVIQEDLFSKPEIFVVLPAPFGEEQSNTDKGLMGVNVANPTDGIMNVTKVVFTATDPEGGGGFKMFKRDCPVENISPWGVSGAGDWKCVLDNQLRWININNPIQIPPRSVYSFLAKVESGGMSGAEVRDLESMPIQITVVTSSGQFGKAGYDSSLNNGADVFANVFLGNGLGTIANNNLNSSRTNILNNTLTTLDIWLVDFDTDSSTKIKGINPDGKSTTLIINIPQGWLLPSGVPANNATWNFQYSVFPDTSSQLLATLKNDLGGSVSAEGKKLTITVRAPIVQETKMYVFHILANGVSQENFSVTPLMEMVVQVCGTTACT